MFCKTKNKKVLDRFGNEILFRGVGLGGWMLPEGYMWGCHKYYERPRTFEELVRFYMEDEAQLFWDEYYKHYTSDKDFELIKAQGHNSIRLPFNFRLLMEENETSRDVVFNEYGFKMIDYVIEQCKKHDLYVVLDLHGAPGGQTGTNIDDSKYNKPELFTKEIYKLQTITLWEEIARRYKDEEIVAMYDLLNEPLPDWNRALYGELMPLYNRIIEAIRKIDQNHMISLEGAHWATEFSMFDELIDDNIIIHFHKYWSPPSIETIQQFLDVRERFNVPLYMGEGGENDLYWYSGAFKMYNQLDISWNFWTYKKITNDNSIISFDKPDDWSTIFDKDNPLPKKEGKKLLLQFLENIKFENCTVNEKVSKYLYQTDEYHTVAGFYDYHGKDRSYHVEKEHLNPVMRPNDKVHIVNKDGNPYQGCWGKHNKQEIEEELYPFVKCNAGDFYNYSFNISNSNLNTIREIEITHNGLEYDLEVNGVTIENSYKAVTENNVLTVRAKNNGILKEIRFK